jgi:hypothetical protein
LSFAHPTRVHAAVAGSPRHERFASEKAENVEGVLGWLREQTESAGQSSQGLKAIGDLKDAMGWFRWLVRERLPKIAVENSGPNLEQKMGASL